MDQSAETLPLEDSLGLPDWIIDNSMEDGELPNPVSERSVPDFFSPTGKITIAIRGLVRNF
jgi:hypothetical protein